MVLSTKILEEPELFYTRGGGKEPKFSAFFGGDGAMLFLGPIHHLQNGM